MSVPEALNALTLPLHGMRLIEASAGTGKTFTIAALYLRLVLGHGSCAADIDPTETATAFARALSPREILVVTFTRAAVEELRGRIRKRLQEASTALRLETLPQDPILAELYCYYEKTGQRLLAVRVLQQAAENMDEAAIFTIHSWCQQVLQQHAFVSGAGFNRQLQQDQRSLLERCVEDYWRTWFYPLSESSVYWLHEKWKTPAGLMGYVQKALRVDEAPRDLHSPLLLQAAIDNLRELQRRFCEEASQIAHSVESLIASGVMNKTSYPEARLREQLDHLRAWSQSAVAVLPEVHNDKAKGLEWWAKKQISDKFKKGSSFELHPFFAAIDRYLEQFAKPLIIKDCIAHATAWVQQRLVREKARLATVHFDDLVNDVYFALTGVQGERLAEVLRERFPVALIDEFQDTDARQYASFNAIYASSPANALLLIGDPKQAIYGFRGADIFTYLQARHDTQGRHYNLDTNYRSVPALIDGINHLFDLSGRGIEKLPFVFEGIPFVPVLSRPASKTLRWKGQEVAPLTLWSLMDGVVDGKTYQQVMATHAANTIAELLQSASRGESGFVDADNGREPLKAADMAVLVRGRGEAAAIRDALAQRGVRSVYLSERDSVFATAEAKTLLAWLQAVAQPEDERCLRVALAEPQLRLSNDALDRLHQDEIEWEKTLEQFKHFRAHWQRHGVLPMLRELLQTYAVPQHLLREAGGERVLTNLLHLSEWLQAAAATLEGEHALIRHLQDKIRIAEQEEGNDELTLRLESDEQLLKIITIHKSKGLEYPLVFLPFVSMPGRKLSPPYVYHDASGNRRIYWKDGDEDAEKSALEAAEREQLAEDLRLFYVAVTRAKHACWLGLAPVGTPAKEKKPAQVLAQNPLAWLLGGKSVLTDTEYGASLNGLANSSTAIVASPLNASVLETTVCVSGEQTEQSLTPARTMSRPLPRDWTITSYTGILFGAVQAQQHAIESEVESTSIVAPVDSSLPEENVLQEERLRERQTMASSNVDRQDDGGFERDESIKILVPEPQSLHAFPAGANPGTFLHTVLEWAGENGFDRFLLEMQRPESAAILQTQLHILCEQRHFSGWEETLWQWLRGFLSASLPLDRWLVEDAKKGDVAITTSASFQMGRLSRDQYQMEMEFWLGLARLDQQKLDAVVQQSEFAGEERPGLLPRQFEGMLKGFMDLVCVHDGRYYVVDYKSNRLGEKNSDYHFDAMRDAMLHHRYELQYVLYTIALHRLLKSRLGDSYDYDKHVGGAIYLFLRGVDAQGNGVFVRRVPRATIERLERSLGGYAQ